MKITNSNINYFVTPYPAVTVFIFQNISFLKKYIVSYRFFNDEVYVLIWLTSTLNSETSFPQRQTFHEQKNPNLTSILYLHLSTNEPMRYWQTYVSHKNITPTNNASAVFGQAESCEKLQCANNANRNIYAKTNETILASIQHPDISA